MDDSRAAAPNGNPAGQGPQPARGDQVAGTVAAASGAGARRAAVIQPGLPAAAADMATEAAEADTAGAEANTVAETVAAETEAPEGKIAAGGRTAAGGATVHGRSWPGLNRWLSLVTAFAAGLALAGAFPPVGFWPLAMAGPGLLTVAVWGKRRLATLALALTSGLVFYLALLSWLVNVAWYAWITLAVIEAVIFAVLALALPPLLRLRTWPLGVAGWWVLQEAVHDRFPWGGFPWGRLAMSQAGAPTAGWAAIGGPPLLTFLLALAGASLAYLVIVCLAFGPGQTQPGQARPGKARSGQAQPGQARPGKARSGQARPRRRVASVAAMLAALAVGAALAGDLVWTAPSGPGPTAVIATVQGNVPHARNLPNLLRATRVTANHAAATIALARSIAAGRRPDPAIVIWPENSTDIDPRLSALTYENIAAAVNAIGRPVLVGAVLNYPLRNAGQLWLPGRGPTQEYVKRQLVPFGEVIPLRGLLNMFTSLPALQPRNFRPGNRAVVFRVGPVRLGDVICYEVGFDNLVRSEVMAGANLLTVQTNDADFELDGQTGESLQQLAMARLDAVTTGRAVAVASTTGVSAIIAPDGSILRRSKIWQRTALEARVPLRTALTPADRAGNWPELTIIALTVLGLAWSLARAWRRRSG